MSEENVVGCALRRARVLYCQPLREVARRLGLSATALDAIERGRAAASDAVLQHYADSFRMDVRELRRAQG